MTKYEGVTMAGKLVVVEGIDGCGKTTLVRNLVPKIEERKKFKLTRKK